MGSKEGLSINPADADKPIILSISTQDKKLKKIPVVVASGTINKSRLSSLAKHIRESVSVTVSEREICSIKQDSEVSDEVRWTHITHLEGKLIKVGPYVLTISIENGEKADQETGDKYPVKTGLTELHFYKRRKRNMHPLGTFTNTERLTEIKFGNSRFVTKL